jgi:hypothetical protein
MRLKDQMFCANDANFHAVYWSKIGRHWALEDMNGRVDSHRYLCSALTAMHVRVARNKGIVGYGVDYDTVIDDWTTRLNPY